MAVAVFRRVDGDDSFFGLVEDAQSIVDASAAQGIEVRVVDLDKVKPATATPEG